MNLAFGSRTTLLELIAEIESIWGCALPRVHVDPRPGDVAHSQADATVLRGLFPDIEPVAFADAVRITVDWFRTLDGN